MPYEPRTYRNLLRNDDLLSLNLVIEETDLLICIDKQSDKLLVQRKAEKLVLHYRKIIQDYIAENPSFKTTLKPYPADTSAANIIKTMIDVSRLADVGPMASVAGVIADYVGNELLACCREVIIENGGDIFLKIEKKRNIGIYAGESKFSNTLSLQVMPEETPLGICTSSGTIGHSLSMGKADAVVVAAPSAALADAWATALANMIHTERDIGTVIEHSQDIGDITGVIIIKGDTMGVCGQLKLSTGKNSESE